MKNLFIRTCAFLLTMLGFASCGIARKSAEIEPSNDSTAVEKSAPGKDFQTLPDSTSTNVNVRPGMKVMYGPPPASYRK